LSMVLIKNKQRMILKEKKTHRDERKKYLGGNFRTTSEKKPNLARA